MRAPRPRDHTSPQLQPDSSPPCRGGDSPSTTLSARRPAGFAPRALLCLAVAAALCGGLLAAPAGAQDGAVPARPRSLAAEVSPDSVTLTWRHPQDATITGYVILRRDKAIHEEGTFATVTPDTGSAATTYTDDMVQRGRRYVYRIKAINAHGLSERSSWVRAYTVPARPRTLTAPVVAHNTVTLSWRDPQDDSITGYLILRRDKAIHAEGIFATVASDTGTAATSYTDDTVEPNKQYVYRIKAINAAGESDISSWVRAYTPAAPDPAALAPSGLTAEATADGVALDWNAPAEDAASVTGYEILRAQGDAELAVLVADTGNAATAYTDETATQGSATYAYQVKAIRGGERSQASSEARVQLPPAAPQGVAGAAAHDSVILIWTGPQDDTITGYRILRRQPTADDPGEFVVLTEDTGSATTTYTDAEVAPSTGYTYRVQAISPHGASEPSRDVPVDTPAAPEPPRTLPAETTQQDGTSDEATVSEPEGEDFPSSTATRGYVAIGESATGEIDRLGDQTPSGSNWKAASLIRST